MSQYKSQKRIQQLSIGRYFEQSKSPSISIELYTKMIGFYVECQLTEPFQWMFQCYLIISMWQPKPNQWRNPNYVQEVIANKSYMQLRSWRSIHSNDFCFQAKEREKKSLRVLNTRNICTYYPKHSNKYWHSKSPSTAIVGTSKEDCSM